MRGRSDVAVVLLGAGALAFETLAFLLGLGARQNELFVLLPVLVSLLFYAGTFLCKWHPDRSWEDSANSVFADLWTAGKLVDRKEGGIDLRLNWASILRFRTDKAGTVTYCQAEHTESANLVMIFSFITVLAAPLVVIIAAYAYLTASEFSTRPRTARPASPGLEKRDPSPSWSLIETMTDMRDMHGGLGGRKVQRTG